MDLLMTNSQEDLPNLIQPFIVNGNDIDPLTVRLYWEQHFPPRCDWVTFSRHQNPCENRVQKLLRLVFDKKSKNRVKNILIRGCDILDTSNDAKNKTMNVHPQEEDTRNKLEVTKRKCKKVSRKKGSKVKPKTPLYKMSSGLQKLTERLINEPLVFKAINKNSKCPKSDQHKERQKTLSKKPKHSNKDPITKLYELPEIKTRKPEEYANFVHLKKEFPQRTLKRLPPLKIPKTLKWSGKSHKTEPIPELPLPTSWHWYMNPNQFIKKRMLSSDAISLVQSNTTFLAHQTRQRTSIV